MAYIYELTANNFRPYSEYPKTLDAWIKVLNNDFLPFQNVYMSQVYGLNADNEIEARMSQSHQAFLCYGNNENNTSFDVFFVATTDRFSRGPYYFNVGSSTSREADYGGIINSGSYYQFGAWKIGTISASNRDNAFNFSNYIIIGYDDGVSADATEPVSVSSEMAAALQKYEQKTGAQYPGCYNVLVNFTVPSTVDIGKTSVQASLSLSGGTGSFDLSILDGLSLTNVSNTNKLSWNNVLPYVLESRYEDNELRKTTFFKYKIEVDEAKPLFVNGSWRATLDNTVSSAEFLLQVDPTRLPSFTAASGTKISNHDSMYVMLVNGYDKITFAATVKDQSYPYNNDYNNYLPRFALYCGDVNLGNYRPVSTTKSDNTVVTTYSGEWGPLSVNPPVALGTNQALRMVYQDRFGRQASSNLTLTYNSSSIDYLRFYNYINPTWGISAMRVNSSGVPDDVGGTYIKITYNWSVSQLDYVMNPHTGTKQPTIKVTNNQDSTVNTFTLTTESGTNNYILSDKLIEKSYIFTAVLTDATGRTFTLNAFVPSGEVYLDFKAGGSGLAIGMRAENAEQLDIGWQTHMHNGLQVDGAITGPTITDIYSKMSGAVTSLPASSITVDAPLDTTLGTNVQSALTSLNNTIGTLSSGGGGVEHITMYDGSVGEWNWLVFPSNSSEKFAIATFAHQSTSSYLAEGTANQNFIFFHNIILPLGFSSISQLLLNGMNYLISSSETYSESSVTVTDPSLFIPSGKQATLKAPRYNASRNRFEGDYIPSSTKPDPRYIFATGFIMALIRQ